MRLRPRFWLWVSCVRVIHGWPVLRGISILTVTYTLLLCSGRQHQNVNGTEHDIKHAEHSEGLGETTVGRDGR